MQRATDGQGSQIVIGQRIVGQFALTPAEIATFATLSGDLNPLHHDEHYAQQTQFGGIIVSGPQMISLMMGLTATHFSAHGAVVGLEFSFNFRKAVLAGEPIAMEWEVVAVEPKARLHGNIVSLKGKATNHVGSEVITASGKVLVTAKFSS